MKIFGYDWEDIQRMQRGEKVGRAVPGGDTRPRATEGDIGMLEEWGVEGLVARQYWGVLDRLVRSGIIEDKEYWR